MRCGRVWVWTRLSPRRIRDRGRGRTAADEGEVMAGAGMLLSHLLLLAGVAIWSPPEGLRTLCTAGTGGVENCSVVRIGEETRGGCMYKRTDERRQGTARTGVGTSK